VRTKNAVTDDYPAGATRDILRRMKALVVIALVFLSWSSASANFILTLKNGRRITVQNYREDGSLIKFHGMGGEIGVSKDQIESIRKAGVDEHTDLNLPAANQMASPPPAKTAPRPSASSEPLEKKSLDQEEQRIAAEEETINEEKQYQQSLRDVTQQLQTLRDRYSELTRGTATKDPTLVTNQEQAKARTDDLIARQKDAQQNPADPGVLRLLTPSPFSTHSPTTTELRPSPPTNVPFATQPPSYTDRQQQLLDLRNQMIQLEQERARLINEMRQKNFDSGSLFLE
jgi:hypothetical protein